MKCLYVVCFVVVFKIFALSVDAKTSGCTLEYQKDFPPHEPVIVIRGRLNYTFPDYGEKSINVQPGKLATFVCPGKNNFLQITNNGSISGTCISGTRFKIGGESYSFSQLTCEKVVTGEVRETKAVCANNEGLVKEIGYSVDKRSWVSLIKVCYNDYTGEAIYAQHTLNGVGIKNAEKENERPTFRTPGVSRNAHVSLAYKKAFQKGTFNRILGSAKLGEKYISDKSFLARGHYAPDGDFLLAALQFTTYYYINTSPQWQAVNGGNWKSVENSVRKMAASSKVDFEIYTGAFGILKLKDINGKEQEIYLSNGDTLPVSKYIWKVVYNPKSKDAIVFVALNNPFVNKSYQLDVCRNICNSAGWDSNSWDNPSKGLVICCDVREFFDLTDRVPKIHVNGVLHNK